MIVKIKRPVQCSWEALCLRNRFLLYCISMIPYQPESVHNIFHAIYLTAGVGIGLRKYEPSNQHWFPQLLALKFI